MPNETILMALLNEGTDVWRPVQAERLSDGRYKILGSVPEDENWEFAPGSVVHVRQKQFSQGTALVAVSGH